MTSVALVTLCFLSSAAATTLLKLDMDALVSKSETIVHGKVIDISSQKESGRIYTYITVETLDTLKGESSERVTFRNLGGRVGDLVTMVHGMPDFAMGEEVVVFLERPLEDKPLVVTGMVQGKFHVALGPDQKTRYVVPALGDTPLVERKNITTDEGTIRERLSAAAPDSLHAQVLDLSAFKAQVQRAQ